MEYNLREGREGFFCDRRVGERGGIVVVRDRGGGKGGRRGGRAVVGNKRGSGRGGGGGREGGGEGGGRERGERRGKEIGKEEENFPYFFVDHLGSGRRGSKRG